MTAHVLLVEDSPLITGALRLLLESAGYQVTIAATAAEAIAAGTARRADVLLLDLGLPDADGLSVVTA
ncbi:MAG: response regulator, partial [Gemmatimonadaceae bacterium]